MSIPSEKRRLLDECLGLEGKALAVFSESGDMLEYGKTYNELSQVFWLRSQLEWDRQTSRSIIEKGLKWGEKAVAVLSELGDLYEIARAHFTSATCLSHLWYYFIAEPEEKDKTRLKAVEHLRNAVEFSERVEDTFLVGLSHLWLGVNKGGEESIRHFEKALECGEKTRDNYLQGRAPNCAACMTFWKVTATEDPDQRRKLVEKAMEFYDKVQHHYSIMSFPNQCGRVVTPAEYYLYLAMWETGREKKLEFLKKSEKAGMNALKVVEDSDIPYAILTVLLILSRTLQARARMAPDFEGKRRLLEKALKYRERTIEIMERWPFAFGVQHLDRGAMHNYLAEIEAELGYLEPDLNSKRRLLEEAVSNKEKCLKLTTPKMVSYLEKMGRTTVYAALREYQDTYGTLMNRLYELTSNPQYLRKAIEMSQKAIESASKLDMISRIAESYWKIAKAQDILGKHLEAAKNFERASESYVKAGEKIPQLKDFYQDHASYMKAWNEIEKAKHHHAEKHYGQAKEHHEEAADLHKSTERWNYLASNYLAWAKLEDAEDLSRREQGEKVTGTFKEAADLFCKAKTTIETELKKIQDMDEKRIATELIKASDLRREYCQGRIAVEEAKILDRQGDHVASSKKYGSAAETFQKTAKAESEQTRKELNPIIYLCQAWQKMMMAEATASPTMYGEAAELFKQAKEHTLDQPTSLLALANSSFCKALEAGTEFEITRDMTIYSTAKKHLEAAASHYLKAGFKDASEYARATHRLFDAYIYMDKAEAETEPRKKAQYYQLAEKLLQASAGSYMKAKHPEKSEQVRRLLESVKEERQLAISLTEVLHAPTIASATTSFSTPTPTHEQAVGLERFEHADIQANLILRVREVKVGEDVNLEIELVNAGKSPALLIKVQELIPEGFEIKRAPEIYRVEDRYLNMKGRRLAPLKTEEVRLVLRPENKGIFTLKPRIMYLDETGRYRSHEPEPVIITVKELGIKGWIKGEK